MTMPDQMSFFSFFSCFNLIWFFYAFFQDFFQDFLSKSPVPSSWVNKHRRFYPSPEVIDGRISGQEKTCPLPYI